MEKTRSGRREGSSDSTSSDREVPGAASFEAMAAATVSPPRSVGSEEKAAASGPVFTEHDVGRIIAIASQLQAEKGKAKAAAVTSAELASLAKQFGIDEDCLQKAIELSEQGARSIVLKGSLEKVRSRILARFANVHVKNPRNQFATITPRLLVEGTNGVEIQWADRRLTIRLIEKSPGVVRVEWEPDIGDTSRRQAKDVGFLLGAVFSISAAAAVAVTGAWVAAGAVFAGTALAFVAASKGMQKKVETEFDEMCTSELKNIEVLGLESEGP